MKTIKPKTVRLTNRQIFEKMVAKSIKPEVVELNMIRHHAGLKPKVIKSRAIGDRKKFKTIKPKVIKSRTIF